MKFVTLKGNFGKDSKVVELKPRSSDQPDSDRSMTLSPGAMSGHMASTRS